jgi:hypothetical protein
VLYGVDLSSMGNRDLLVVECVFIRGCSLALSQ